jgi:FAD/FMN-containing dehydrogenase
VLGYDSMADAGDHVPQLLELEPTAVEGIHESVPRNMSIKGRPLAGAALLPDGRMFLMVEFGGETQGEANASAEEARRRVETHGGPYRGLRVCGTREGVRAIWKIRESGVAATSWQPRLATDENERVEPLRWGGRRVSNPRPPEPQSGVLPLNYAHHTAARNF